MLKINNTSNQDLSELENTITDFFPYAQKRLNFDKPVSLNLVSDEDNSKNVFGKTAYYQPDSHEITIFVDRRHPKDMLRSFSHELVHHAQNCRGDFDHNMTTEEGYAQNDSHMRKCEGEAYLLGNGFLVRDYEDHLKSKEKNKMAINEKMIRKVIQESINTVLEKNKKDAPDRRPTDTPADRLRPLEEEDGVFTPNHYCVHHGGVQMNGTVQEGKVVAHNWDEKLQKVTKYDMKLADGTILEGVNADDILVTDASLEEGHGGHMAKRDDDKKEDMEEAHCPGNRDEDEDLKEVEELEEGELPPGLKAYQDKKKGSADSDSDKEEKDDDDSDSKPDKDGDGVPDYADKKPGKDDNKTMNEAFFHPRHQRVFENLKNRWCK
jgi:hypothetical protein